MIKVTIINFTKTALAVYANLLMYLALLINKNNI